MLPQRGLGTPPAFRTPMHFVWTLPRIALRSLIRQPRRTALALSAVTFGAVALMLASGFIDWIFYSMREMTIHAQLGHLQIVRPGYYEAGLADPLRFLLPRSDPVADLVRRQPGVVAVAPRLHFAGLASRGDTTISFTAEGVDPVAERKLSSAITIDQGAALDDTDPSGVLFGAGLAHNLGVRVGDAVVLMVSTPSGGVNAVDAKVRGIFSTISKAYDDAALRAPIGLARKLLRVQGEQTLVVLLDHTSRTDQVLAALRHLLPPAKFQVTPWYRLADFYNKTVALFSKQLAVVRAIVAVIIVLSIANTMVMAVMERTGEIGTAMALGATRREVGIQFVVEGIALGLAGGVLGVVLAFALASAISAIGIPMPPPPGMAQGYLGQIRLTPALAAEAVALAAVTALAASIFPALKAARMPIVDALRTNR